MPSAESKASDNAMAITITPGWFAPVRACGECEKKAIKYEMVVYRKREQGAEQVEFA